MAAWLSPPGSNRRPLWVRAGVVAPPPLFSGHVQGFPEQPPVVDYGRQRRPGGLHWIRSPSFCRKALFVDCALGWLCAGGPAQVRRDIPDHRHPCRKTKWRRMNLWGRTKLLGVVTRLYQIVEILQLLKAIRNNLNLMSCNKEKFFLDNFSFIITTPTADFQPCLSYSVLTT